MSQPKNLDPASMKEFYGAELRRRREEAGFSQCGLGELLFCSGSYIGQLEMAIRNPQLDMSEQIDAILKTDGFFRRLCEAIGKAAKAKYAAYFATAAELEQRAQSISEFASMVVPGLLQTPEFTRALIRASRPLVDEEELERHVAARQERSRTLVKQGADPELWFVLHEAALRVPVGDNAVVRGQLEHIVEVARNHQAIVQVMPYSSGLNSLMYGAVKLMTFEDEPSVAYTETAHSGQLIDDPTVVARFAKSYDLARAAAMTREASLDFIGRLVEDRTP